MRQYVKNKLHEIEQGQHDIKIEIYLVTLGVLCAIGCTWAVIMLDKIKEVQ